MTIERKALQKDTRKVNYIACLMDNSSDIEINRKHPAIIICRKGGDIKCRAQQECCARFAGINTF